MLFFCYNVNNAVFWKSEIKLNCALSVGLDYNPTIGFTFSTLASVMTYAFLD